MYSNHVSDAQFFKQSTALACSLPILVLCLLILSLSSCSTIEPSDVSVEKVQPPILTLQGQWLVDQQGQILVDPQPSGLTLYDDKLVMISDASADDSQVKQLHFIDPNTGMRHTTTGQYVLTETVAAGCFAQYLQTKPDLEALIRDPQHPNGFITVTEDASVLGKLTPACQLQYKATGSTQYPTVLVRLLWDNNVLSVTGVRAVQFPTDALVGNSPNDGIEGLSIVDRTLYLALEKDANYRARIFSTLITDDFWQRDEFVRVSDTAWQLPDFFAGRTTDKREPHPINGTDIVTYQDTTWLVAAARNDNQLWLVDTAQIKATKVVKLAYLAPNYLRQSKLQPDELSTSTNKQCALNTVMHNASLEGVAVDDQTVYLVNDPWKVNYWKNIQCENTRPWYATMMGGLLFTVSVEQLFLHARDIGT